MISEFYKKTPQARREALSFRRLEVLAGPIDGETRVHDRMIENVIGAWRIPLGVLTGLVVAGREHRVAMATEEPSVVAAINRAARVLNASGGIEGHVETPVTYAQILCSLDAASFEDFRAFIASEKTSLLARANETNGPLVNVGGGAFDLTLTRLNSQTCDVADVELCLAVHTVDAMGANAVNTMAEAIQAAICLSSERFSGFEPCMAIVSNRGDGRRVGVKVEIPYEILTKYAREAGATVARRIAKASQFAAQSAARAVTHNKGILNGIIAAATVLGQDTRAMSAAIDDWACRGGQHRPLSTWDCACDRLVGRMTLPLVVGFAGGFRQIESVDAAFEFDGIDAYKTLCLVLGGVGMAQNFAALWALTTEGIQAGHMKLHRRKADLLPDETR